MRSSAQLKIPHYYWLEGLSAVNCTIFTMCLFFWTRERFAFSDATNLLLASVQGLVYLFSTFFGGRLADRFGYDRTLIVCFAGMGATLVTGSFIPCLIMPFVALALYNLFVGPTWPSLEAAILHSPGKLSMPNRLGIYNLSWSFGDGIGLFLSGFMFKWNPDSIFWLPGLIYLLTIPTIRWGPRNHDDEGVVAMEMPHTGDTIPKAQKRRFMQLGWLGNGLGFLMLAGFTALAPQMSLRLGLPTEATLWLTCTLLFARGFAFLIFWKWEGWHYHMAWCQWALWLAPLSLAIAFFAGNPAVVFGSLVVFGASIGLSYSGSIYYSLDYGDNKGELGGLHESILGLGMFIGPLLAAGAAAMGHGATSAQWTLIILSLGANAIGLAILNLKEPPPSEPACPAAR
ncbi:MAG: MFS transporter [Verrucomicrobiae bacterium]|nr:MFS transporter [Verrucomicrobiae bacterium]